MVILDPRRDEPLEAGVNRIDVLLEEPSSEVLDKNTYRCPNCAANMLFDASTGTLKCGYCEQEVEIKPFAGTTTIVESELQKGIAQTRQDSNAPAFKISECQDCGAKVSFDESQTATSCDFCGSSQILSSTELRRIIKPIALIPFGFDKKSSGEAFSTWIHSLWFRPNALKKLAKVETLNGVYVPFWTLDAHVASDWTARSGTYYYRTEQYRARAPNGQMTTMSRQVREVRWRPAWGSRDDFYDDILICGSKGLKDHLVHKISTFEGTELVPYKGEYLAGWKSEEYGESLELAWGQAQDIIEQRQRTRCGHDVPGDTFMALQVRNATSRETFKHILLPVWVAGYRYKGQVYQFLVNGKDGNIHGEAPYSVIKVAAAVILLVAAALLLWFLYQQGQF